MATYTAKLGQFQVTDRPDLGTIEGVQLLPSAEDVAIEFCGQLADALSGRQLADVVDRNNKETDPGICHSHDFCDANELMAAAFENLGVQTSDDVELWDDAWDIAKAAEFDAKKIVTAK